MELRKSDSIWHWYSMTCHKTRSLLYVSWIWMYWPRTMSKLSWIMSVVKLKTGIKTHKKKKINYWNTLIIRTALIWIYNTNVIPEYPIYYHYPTTRTGPFLPAEINPHLANTIYFISVDIPRFAFRRNFEVSALGTGAQLRTVTCYIDTIHLVQGGRPNMLIASMSYI